MKNEAILFKATTEQVAHISVSSPDDLLQYFKDTSHGTTAYKEIEDIIEVILNLISQTKLKSEVSVDFFDIGSIKENPYNKQWILKPSPSFDDLFDQKIKIIVEFKSSLLCTDVELIK